MSRARDFADLAGSADAGGITGRNLVTNGAMQVAQRSTSATGIGGANGFFTVDRWKIFQAGSTAGRLTQSQASVTDLAGFPNSLKHEVTTADTSIAANELLQLAQTFEGQNLQALKKGYSDASSFTLSFYVKGTAKTYVVEMYDGDNTRHVAQTFSVTSSWSRVELTFPADTTGKFDDDNALSLYLLIWLHAGSTYTSGTLPSTWASVTNANRAVGAGSLFSATSNTFEITGVQLEVGSATDFEHEDVGTTLRKCQRYFQTFSYMNGYTHHMFNATQAYGFVQLPGGPMRATPSASLSDTGSDTMHVAGSSKTISGVAVAASRPDGILHRVDLSSSATAGHAAHYDNSSTPYILISAEL